MDERIVQNVLMEMLYSAMNEAPIDISVKEKLTPEVLASVYALAKQHDLSHIVSQLIYQNNIETEEALLTKLQRDEVISVYRYEQMQYAYKEICEALDEAKISYVPLKGSVIRKFYPSESMRTSCDIDVLIHEEDVGLAVESLGKRGYSCGERHYHDISLYSPGKVHLELHFSIQEDMDNIDAVLKDAWDYSVLTEGSRYEFKKEFFVFYAYAHMAYHFLFGGCGIRSLMDIWVLEHKMDAPYSCAEELLKKAGIYQFAAQMSEISNRCFTDKDVSVSESIVLKYIYNGGIYGSEENHAAVQKTQIKSTAKYILKRLFLPYKAMIILYPILKKAPYLLPACWVLRWLGVIFGAKSKRIMSEISNVKDVSDSTIAEIKEIRSGLGI